MVLKILASLVLSLTAATAQAQDESILVDAPLVCMSQESAAAVVRYYYEGGYDLANSFADEFAEDCFMLEESSIPRALTSKLVVLWRGVSVEYGYIPIPFAGADFFMFFLRISGKGVPV